MSGAPGWESGLDPLLEELERAASRELAARREAACAEAERIRQATAVRAAERRAQALRECEARVRVEHEGALAEARRAAQARLLDARWGLVDRVLTAALAELPALAERAASDAVLVERTKEVLSYLGDAPAVLHAAPALATRVQHVLAGRDAVRVETDPGALTGLRAVSADGRVVVDDTLEARLRRMRAALAIEIMRAAEEP